MAITLPQIIQKYVDSSNRYDVQSILSCFSDDAVVHDEGETLHGKKAIADWITKTIAKYKFHFNPLSINRTLRKSLSKWKYPERSMEARLFLIIILSSRETKFCRSQLVNSEP